MAICSRAARAINPLSFAIVTKRNPIAIIRGYGERGGRKAPLEESAPLNLFARLARLPGSFCRLGPRGSVIGGLNFT